jgi:acetylornithine deacetylase/succinyl-diaminopimelate desuccinylase-like protein
VSLGLFRLAFVEFFMSQLDAVLNRIDTDLDASLVRLFALLRIQSVSTDPAYKDSCRAAADYVAADLKSIGFAAEVRPTQGHPIVIGKSGNGKAHDKSASGKPANGKPHVLFYGHYDVQPVDPLQEWTHPPFEPRLETLPDGRKIIIARGACDDKGQAMTFIEACRAYRAVTGALPLPITMMIEGEEECGSKNLFGFVRDNADEFKLDLALICDTSMWDQKTPAITTSLRGLVYEEIRLTCADRDLHSGLFGGAAQNQLRVLSKILAAMHDDNGRVTVPGFYDGVAELPAEVKADLKGLNLTAETFLGQVGLKAPAGEKDRMLIERHRRLHRRGGEDGHPRQGARQGLVPPGGTTGPEEDPGGVPRLRQSPAAGRLHGGVRQFRRFPGHPATVRQPFARQGPGGAPGRMGQEDHHDGRRRLDPDRRRFQERARHGLADGRVRPR